MIAHVCCGAAHGWKDHSGMNKRDQDATRLLSLGSSRTLWKSVIPCCRECDFCASLHEGLRRPRGLKSKKGTAWTTRANTNHRENLYSPNSNKTCFRASSSKAQLCFLLLLSPPYHVRVASQSSYAESRHLDEVDELCSSAGNGQLSSPIGDSRS